MDMFTDLFREYEVTWIECVPLIFSAAVGYLEVTNMWSRLDTLRVWSCIGAAYQLGPAQRAHRHLPNLQFWNSFAPTENCFVTTCHRVTEAELAKKDQLYRVPIGRPVPGWSCYLLAEDEEPPQLVPQMAHAAGEKSVSGVLHVDGPGVFQGYLNRPDLTEAAMVSHPAFPYPLLRVGDQCHYDAEGELVYEGRRDMQVKLQGQRLELGEIESVIALHPDVDIAVVSLIKPNPDEPEYDYLAAYLVLSEAAAAGAIVPLVPGLQVRHAALNRKGVWAAVAAENSVAIVSICYMRST